MHKLKVLLNELEMGIETSLSNEFVSENYKGKEKRIVDVIYNFQQELLSQLFSMQVVESQIQSSSSEIIETLEEQKITSDAMLQSSKALNMVNEKSKDMVSNSIDSAKRISENTELLKVSSNQLTETTEQAKVTVDKQVIEVYKIIDMVNNVSNTSNKTVQSINDLNEGINKITEILQSVQNFYNQTKLLALNASIESARAGEAGKGFAVVANEIGNLAEGSSKSVEEIVEIMRNIDDFILKVKDNSATEKQQVELAVGKAKKVTIGLSEITTSFTDIEEKLLKMNNDLERNNELSSEVNHVLEDTNIAFSKVTNEISGIDEHIHNQHKHTEKILDIEGILKDITKSLNLITDRYHIDMLSEVKTNIGNKSKEIIEDLTYLVTKDLLDEVQGITSSGINKTKLNKAMQDKNYIEAIWTNNVQGDFIYSNPSAGIKNASIRNWFKQGLKGQGFVSDIYISGISKSPCITISIPMVEDKQVKGILGVDVRIKQL